MKTICLQLISDVLESNDGDISENIKKFGDSYKEIAGDDSSSNVSYYAEQILSRFGKEGGGKLEKFVENLEALKPQSNPFGGYMIVPDLSSLPDADLKALLLKILDFQGEIRFENNTDADRMVAVILENPDKLKAPMWDLVRDKDDVALFELFLTKPVKDEDSWSKNSAEENYIAGLIASGRLEDAGKYLLAAGEAKGDREIRLGADILGEIPAGRNPAELIEFFEGLLRKDPGLNVWPVYLELTTRASKRDEAQVFLKTTVEKKDVSQALRNMYAESLLASDKVDDAVAFLQSELVRFDGMKAPTEEEAGSYLHSAVRLVRIGTLLEKEEVIAQGFAAADKAAPLVRKLSSYRHGVDSGYLDLLVEHERFGKAEEAVAEELVLKSMAEQRSGSDRSNEMTQLVYVYSEAGRHEDVLKLLNEGTMWDAGNLSEIDDKSVGKTSLYLIVAEALVQTGQADKALPIVKRALAKSPGDDKAYEILLSIGAEGTMQYLDQLAELNPYQERPLIWQAKMLADEGKLEEAERMAMAGIGIDPSDGEQGSGDRMRAYEVLAEILKKRGDPEKSDFMSSVVKAIRLSEVADKWWAADMTGRALPIYEQALGIFADAYCIQSRLALRYSDLGQFDKAAEHYQRAFELMPSSFGRVESHCFGCEGAFSGEMAQKIAEAVFEELAEKTPDNPQVFYLLGYLRESQGRDADAAVQYAKAVELDPLYINAWKKLQGVAEQAKIPSQRQDEIALRVYELDPYGSSLSEVTDLGKLWETALKMEAKLPPKQTGPLYVLPESESPSDRSRYSHSQDRNAPRSQLIGNDLFRSVLSIVENIS